MAEPGEFEARVKSHIAIDAWREAAQYEFPAAGQQRKPLRGDYAAHAQSLLDQLAAALPAPPAPDADSRLHIEGLGLGALIEVNTMTPAEGSRAKAIKVPSALEFPGQDIVVLRSGRNPNRTEAAVVFVPDAAQTFLRGRISTYGHDPGNARRPDVDRFEAIETIQAAAAEALFTGDVDFAGPAAWWELWVRQPVGQAIAHAAQARGLEVHPEQLRFPDTTVVIVHALPADVRLFAAQTPGAIAEVRRATGTIRPFLERGELIVGQADFVAELVDRMTGPPVDAPRVGVLDTGVAAAHPLIAPGLAGALAYDDAWGTDDHHPGGGHGTGVIGLVLHGDLEIPMNDQRQVELTHAAVSIKLLPPPGQAATDPVHYGIVTQGAVARVEIDHPAVQTFCLATSTEEFSSSGPSSWSGALDQIASGGSPGDAGDPPRPALRRPKRLVVTAAGNVIGGMRADVTAPRPIEDPAQSWNSLTIGGYTTKDTVAAEDAALTPLARANELSPFSRSSEMLPDDLTPIKPEVLFEAGNMLVDAADFCGWNPSVSLLTTGSDVVAEPLTPIWATSAATGMAGHFLGGLEAALPGLWPETYRALAVQSAEWTEPLRRLLIGRGQHWKTGTKAAKQAVLRQVGYGVPALSRAVASARNAVTLTAQAELQPYAPSQDGQRAVYNAMHFYALPWPKQALEALENEVVIMKVTLSYFIEPNLTGRAATRPDTYRSFGLRFAMKKRGETDLQFRARINAAQEHDGSSADDEASYWLLGPKAIAAGSLHCDLWRGRAIELAGHNRIAVYPVGGWWKSHVGQKRTTDSCRYSLLISISAAGHQIDLHSEVTALVDTKAAEIRARVGVVEV